MLFNLLVKGLTSIGQQLLTLEPTVPSGCHSCRRHVLLGLPLYCQVYYLLLCSLQVVEDEDIETVLNRLMSSLR